MVYSSPGVWLCNMSEMHRDLSRTSVQDPIVNSHRKKYLNFLDAYWQFVKGHLHNSWFLSVLQERRKCVSWYWHSYVWPTASSRPIMIWILDSSTNFAIKFFRRSFSLFCTLDLGMGLLANSYGRKRQPEACRDKNILHCDRCMEQLSNFCKLEFWDPDAGNVQQKSCR